MSDPRDQWKIERDADFYRLLREICLALELLVVAVVVGVIGLGAHVIRSCGS